MPPVIRLNTSPQPLVCDYCGKTEFVEPCKNCSYIHEPPEGWATVFSIGPWKLMTICSSACALELDVLIKKASIIAKMNGHPEEVTASAAEEKMTVEEYRTAVLKEVEDGLREEAELKLFLAELFRKLPDQLKSMAAVGGSADT
jgi:hypothetical protein